MSEIEYCKCVMYNCANSYCEIINDEVSTLKLSIIDCMYNILYYKLESSTKINTGGSRLIYSDLCKSVLNLKYLEFCFPMIPY